MLGGGGVLGLLSVRPHFCWGRVGAAKGLLPYFLVPKGNQPTACTLALWWLKFGPTGGGGGEGVGGRLWRRPRTGGGRGPSIGIERGGGVATRPTRRATAPSLGRGSGVVWWCQGEAH